MRDALFLAATAAASVWAYGCGGGVHVIYGPESCSVLTETHDPFKRTFRGGSFRFGNDYMAVGLLREDGDPRILFQSVWVVNGAVQTSAPAGTDFHIALSTGEIFTVQTKDDSPPIVNENRWVGRFTQWIVKAPLTDSQLERLARTPVEAMSIRFGNEDLEYTLPSRIEARLQTLAICLNGHFDTH